jgi:hypothetical protein
MATQIFVKQSGDYFAGYIDVMNGWINRTDHLEPIGFINILKHWLFPQKEFHAIISKGNQIHGIIAEW